MLKNIDDKNKKFELYRFTLICSKNELIKRMQTNNRSEPNIKNAVERIPLYSTHNSVKIDTTGKEIMTIVNQIKREI